MSRPRAATSVATSTSTSPRLNASSAFNRSSWLLSPCSAFVRRPSRSNERARRAQPSFELTKISACVIERSLSSFSTARRLSSVATLKKRCSTLVAVAFGRATSTRIGFCR